MIINVKKAEDLVIFEKDKNYDDILITNDRHSETKKCVIYQFAKSIIISVALFFIVHWVPDLTYSWDFVIALSMFLINFIHFKYFICKYFVTKLHITKEFIDFDYYEYKEFKKKRLHYGSSSMVPCSSWPVNEIYLSFYENGKKIVEIKPSVFWGLTPELQSLYDVIDKKYQEFENKNK